PAVGGADGSVTTSTSHSVASGTEAARLLSFPTQEVITMCQINGADAHTAPDTKPVRLALGQGVATPGALAALEQSGQNAAELLGRHARGDWGTVGAEDWATNDRAVEQGERVLSAYLLRGDCRLWII